MTHQDTIIDRINEFFKSPEYGVVGASSHRSKYGNKVLRCYMQHQKKVWPVNPSQSHIEGLAVVHQIYELPTSVQSLSIITPPIVTEKIVEQAIAHGIKNIWMQPGAESQKAIETCQKHNINIIEGGPCILVVLGFNE